MHTACWRRREAEAEGRTEEREASGEGRKEDGGVRREGEKKRGGEERRRRKKVTYPCYCCSYSFIQLYLTLHPPFVSVIEVLTHLPLSNQQSNTSDTRRNTPLPRQEGIVIWSTLQRDKRIM